LAKLSETFWVLVLLFAFFFLLGAFTPSDGTALTIVIAVLAVLWIAHAVWDSRHRDPHDRAITRARERRGF
jgi:hypothetical protein